MQELSNSQNLNNNVTPGPGGSNSGSDIRESPKMMLPSIQAQQPSTPQQQASAAAASSSSNKPKASFRCGVCSYETSVARNLRIHWTSEKHTHNMAVLENNIKHLQALGFLQQQSQAGIVGGPLGPQIPNLPSGLPAALQQQQQQQQLASAAVAQNLTGLPNLQSFLPEAALADIAYNQALMIQLLHQNNPAAALAAATQQPNFNAVAGNPSGNGSNGSTASLLNAAAAAAAAASGSGNGSSGTANSSAPSAASSGIENGKWQLGASYDFLLEKPSNIIPSFISICYSRSRSQS